jgi:hypothetical protein
MGNMPQEEEWRLLAEEATQEKDPNRLMDIIRALNRALDEQEEQKKTANRQECRLKQLLLNKNVKKTNDRDKDHCNKYKSWQFVILAIGCTFHIYSPLAVEKLGACRIKLLSL